MEEKSIYDFIEDNLNINGKKGRSSQLAFYIKRDDEKIYGVDSNAHLNFLIWQSNIIDSIDFELLKLLTEMVKKLDSTKLEKYLENKTLDINKNIDEIIGVIEKSKNLNKEKLGAFCKENITKTKNISCMYIYLLLASYSNISENHALQRIILKISMFPEFTKLINKFVLDKYPNPDYYRFYIIKRYSDDKHIISQLIEKMEILTKEEKLWIVDNNMLDRTYPGYLNLLEKLDLIDVLKYSEITLKRYVNIGGIIKAVVLTKDIIESDNDLNWLYNLLKEYIIRYDEFNSKYDAFSAVMDVYVSVIGEGVLEEEKEAELKKIYKEELSCDKTLEMLKEEVKNPHLDIFNKIAALDLKEMYLIIYNEFMNDPEKNIELLECISANKELLSNALEELNKKIDWDNISKEIKENKHMDITPLLAYLHASKEFPDLAVKACCKALYCDNHRIRSDVVTILSEIIFWDDSYLEEIEEPLKYALRHEKDPELRALIRNMFDIEAISEDEFRLLSPDETTKEEESEEDTEDEEENTSKEINLKENFLPRLSLDEKSIGMSTAVDEKIVYASRDKNEFFAYCQGDNFGEEYMVRINYNKDYVVNKISCTCGCLQDDGYCKHVAATLMYIDKTKEFKEE